ncbi:bifunctional riboflavin kinase/FAD synthetase [Caldicellulosiruptoraceae bacterium PP1]
MQILNDLISPKEDISVAIGFFDGLHIGHMALINKLKEKKGCKAIFTFKNHPDELIKGHIDYILTEKERLELFSENNIDIVFFIDFTQELMKMTPQQFIDEILIKKLRVKNVIVGYDFTFGYRAIGNAEYLKEKLNERKIDCTIIEPIYYNNQIISSTKIRDYIKSGLIEIANNMLGYNYFIAGMVKKGKALGREIGFPTINISFSNKKIIPKYGVYATYTIIDNIKFPSITNVGQNPTVSDGGINIETHIFDISKELYNKDVKIEFLKYIREEIKFDNIELLKQQINKDIKEVKKLFLNSI